MNAKYWLDTHGRLGWYPIVVPDPPAPTLRIPIASLNPITYIAAENVPLPYLPFFGQISFKLVGIGHSEKTCGPRCTPIAVYR